MPQNNNQAEELKARLRDTFGVSEIEPVATKPAAVTTEPVAAEPTSHGRKPYEDYPWLRWLGAQGVRIGGGLLSAEGWVPGAAISGAADTIAQKIESPDPVDLGQVAIEAGIGAVPFGSIVKRIKPGLSVAGQLTANAARMAGYVEAGNMLRRMYNEGHALPHNLSEAAMDVGTSVVGAKLANVHPRFDSFAGIKDAPISKATEDLEAALKGAAVRGEPRLIKSTEARYYKGKKGGAEIPLSESPVNQNVQLPTDEFAPRETTIGGPDVVSQKAKAVANELPTENPELATSARGEVTPGVNVDVKNGLRIATKGGRKVAASVEATELPRSVQLELDAVDTRPSNVPLEWLDSNGHPLHAKAAQMLRNEAATKELAKQRILERYYKSVEGGAAKEEQAGLNNIVKTEAAHTTANKMQAAEAKAAEKQKMADATQEARNLNAAEKKAQELIEAQRVAAAKAKLEPGEPTVTETAKRKTPGGTETLRRTFRPKEESSGVELDDLDSGGSGGGGPEIPAPVVPTTDPDFVSKTTYSTEKQALKAIAGSGKRGVPKRLGKGKWMAVFEKEGGEEPPAAAASTPEPTPEGPVPTPTGEAVQEPTVPGLGEVHPYAHGIADELKAALAKANEPVVEPTVPESQVRARIAPLVQKLEASLAKDREGRVPPPEEPPAAPVPAKPEPTPESPTGGATAIPEPVKAEAPAIPEKPATEAPKAVPEASEAPVAKTLSEDDKALADELRNWTRRELTSRLNDPNLKDEQFKALVKAELERRGPSKGAAPIAAKPEAPEPNPDDLRNEAPSKAEEPIAAEPAKAPAVAEPAQGTANNSLDRMVSEQGLPEGTVKVDLANAKDGAEVRNRVVNELQKYRAEVQKFEDSRGVDEKGKYIYSEPNPGPRSIHVPGGPTYTFKPDLKQIDNAIARLESNDAADAMKGIVGDTGKAPSTSIPRETNWGPTTKPKVMTPEASEKLGMTPDITENAEVVGPAAAGKPFSLKNASNVNSAESAAALPGDARHAIMRTRPDGATQIIVADNPNKLKDIAAEWKAEAKESQGKYAAKRAVKEGTLPKQYKSWEEYFKASNFDVDKATLGYIADKSYEPLARKGAAPIVAKPEAKVEAVGATTEAPKGKAGKSTQKVTEAKPTESTSKLADLALQEKKAWDYYHDVVKPAVAAGTMTKEELRAAGKAAGELRAQLAQAVKEAAEKGEPIPTFLQPKVVELKPTAASKGKGPTSEELTTMAPEEQEVHLKQAIEELKGKGKKGEKGTIIGGGFGSLQELYEKNPQLFGRLGLSAVGAAAGAATTPDDPISGAVLGGTAGFYAPSVYRAVAGHIKGLPVGSPGRQQAEKALGDKVKDWLTGFAQTVPDYYRASYLSKIPNLAINSWVGPWGASIMGSLESALAGEEKGLKGLKLLLSADKRIPLPGGKFLRLWGKKGLREAKTIVGHAEERGDVTNKLKPGPLKTLLELPARSMTGGDYAARELLIQAGFSEPEARAITLTSEPKSTIAGALGAFRRYKGAGGTVSWAAKMMLPFYRTNANQLEQSWIRTPWGNMVRKGWNMAPVSTRKLAVQSGITGMVMAGSAVMGYNTDPKYLYPTLKFITDFAGPYGATAGVAFLAGAAYKKSGVSVPDAAISSMLRYGRTGTPLPTADYFMNMIKFAGKAVDGKFDPPYGTIPSPFSSKELISLPTAERALYDTNFTRPTKDEYSVFVPFFDKPKLQPKPKSEYRRRMESIKEHQAAKRKAAREKYKQDE